MHLHMIFMILHDFTGKGMLNVNRCSLATAIFVQVISHLVMEDNNNGSSSS